MGPYPLAAHSRARCRGGDPRGSRSRPLRSSFGPRNRHRPRSRACRRPRAPQLVGIDTNREMLKCARVRLDNAGLANCSVRLADIYNLPFPEAARMLCLSIRCFISWTIRRLLSPRRPASCSRVAAWSSIDFAPHNLEFLREEHAHVRLGFAATEIAAWLGECGIGSSSYRELHAGYCQR